MTDVKFSSVLDRLYTKDIAKRKQNKQILTKIYTPSFTPFLYSKGNKAHMKRPDSPRKSIHNRNKFINKNNNTIQENKDEDDEDNENNEDDDMYEGKKKKKVKIIKIKKAKSKAKTKKVSAKFNNNDDSSEEEKNKKGSEEDVVHDRKEVENAFRNKLFRNKSATKRKK